MQRREGIKTATLYHLGKIREPVEATHLDGRRVGT